MASPVLPPISAYNRGVKRPRDSDTVEGTPSKISHKEAPKFKRRRHSGELDPTTYFCPHPPTDLPDPQTAPSDTDPTSFESSSCAFEPRIFSRVKGKAVFPDPTYSDALLRTRTNADKTVELVDGIPKHPNFYLPHGDLMIKTKEFVFRIHRAMLWEMRFFHDMWYDEMGERTVVGKKGITKLGGVDAYEDPDSEAWHYMCYTFYKPDATYPELFTIDLLALYLKISRKYGYLSMRSVAVCALSHFAPSKLESYNARHFYSPPRAFPYERDPPTDDEEYDYNEDEKTERTESGSDPDRDTESDSDADAEGETDSEAVGDNAASPESERNYSREDSESTPSGQSEHECNHELQPADRIFALQLCLEFDIPELLPMASYLCAQMSMKDILCGALRRALARVRTRSDDTPQEWELTGPLFRLDPAQAITILKGREALMHVRRDFMLSPFAHHKDDGRLSVVGPLEQKNIDTQLSLGCDKKVRGPRYGSSDRYTCIEFIVLFCRMLGEKDSSMSSKDNSRRLRALDLLPDDIFTNYLSRHVCPSCLGGFKSEMHAQQRRIWRYIPNAFGLGSWFALEERARQRWEALSGWTREAARGIVARANKFAGEEQPCDGLRDAGCGVKQRKREQAEKQAVLEYLAEDGVPWTETFVEWAEKRRADEATEADEDLEPQNQDVDLRTYVPFSLVPQDR